MWSLPWAYSKYIDQCYSTIDLFWIYFIFAFITFSHFSWSNRNYFLRGRGLLTTLGGVEVWWCFSLFPLLIANPHPLSNRDSAFWRHVTRAEQMHLKIIQIFRFIWYRARQPVTMACSSDTQWTSARSFGMIITIITWESMRLQCIQWVFWQLTAH